MSFRTCVRTLRFEVPLLASMSKPQVRYAPYNRRSIHSSLGKSGSEESAGPLQYDDMPLVWIDLEMNGLDPNKNRIMEVAVLITNGNLDLVDEEGCHFVIKSNEATFFEMDKWCKNQHAQSGLLDKAEESTHTAPEVAKAVHEYITRWVPQPRSAQLAGNSVHFDAMFLRAQGPDVAENGGQLIWKKILDHLHYRIVDVSTLRELSRRWHPKVFQDYLKMTPAGTSHRALADIRGSIQELKYYRRIFFDSPNMDQKNEKETKQVDSEPSK